MPFHGIETLILPSSPPSAGRGLGDGNLSSILENAYGLHAIILQHSNGF
jgi:hypothetical protein